MKSAPPVFLSEAKIAARIETLAAEIAADLPADVNESGLVLVGPLKGALVFGADLLRVLHPHVAHLEIDFLGLSSYGGGTVSSGEVRLTHDVRDPIAGRHILLIDDIVDTGRTLAFAQAHLAAKNPASLRTSTLLDKPSRRVVEVPVQHVGFEIEDVFVVGYGTDYAERYRELPYLGVLET